MNNVRRELEELKLNNISTLSLAYLALFIALVFLATTFLKVPGLNTSYYHLGDTFIFALAIVFGKRTGLIAGALGTTLADLFYAPEWAIFTLIIRGLQGWVVGSTGEAGKLKKNIVALIIGGHIVIIGYALATWILYDWPSVIPEIGGNYAQIGFGAILAIPLSRQLNKFFRK